MHVFIITGTSRGIGEGIARQLLSNQHQLFCLSRTQNQNLIKEAEKQKCQLVYLEQDLMDWQMVKQKLSEILDQIDVKITKSISIIHNAGQLKPVQLIGTGRDPELVYAHTMINQFVPEVLTESFVAISQDWPIQKRVLIISSGAGRKPVAAWSTYCMTKAAVDMYARVLKTEQENKEYPIKVASLAPGVVETDMQKHLRSQSKEDFPGVERFLNLKANNALWSPEEASRHLVSYLLHEGFGENEVDDIRNWLQDK